MTWPSCGRAGLRPGGQLAILPRGALLVPGAPFRDANSGLRTSAEALAAVARALDRETTGRQGMPAGQARDRLEAFEQEVRAATETQGPGVPEGPGG